MYSIDVEHYISKINWDIGTVVYKDLFPNDISMKGMFRLVSKIF